MKEIAAAMLVNKKVNQGKMAKGRTGRTLIEAEGISHSMLTVRNISVNRRSSQEFLGFPYHCLG